MAMAPKPPTVGGQVDSLQHTGASGCKVTRGARPVAGLRRNGAPNPPHECDDLILPIAAQMERKAVIASATLREHGSELPGAFGVVTPGIVRILRWR